MDSAIDFIVFRVGLKTVGDFTISTVKVPWDTCYETCIFCGNESVVVQTYETKTAAKVGHRRWVEKFRSLPPFMLRDLLQNLM